MMKLKLDKVKPTKIAGYRNGNYNVLMYSDGTKIRWNDADEFIPEFPENIDIKITDQCDAGCPFCFEGSTKNGRHSNLHSENHNWIRTLKAGTEVALGGGNVLAYPQFDELLHTLKDQGVIANMTINSIHFVQSFDRVAQYQKDGLINGIGISLNKNLDMDLINKLPIPDNIVLHTIAGVCTYSDYLDIPKERKVIILGYKNLRRGEVYLNGNKSIIDNNINELEDNLPTLLKRFKVLSFDNLALEQLNVKNYVPDDIWAERYMGEDGMYTMYIDMVKEEFALNSTSLNRYQLQNNQSINNIFNIIRHEAN